MHEIPDNPKPLHRVSHEREARARLQRRRLIAKRVTAILLVPTLALGGVLAWLVADLAQRASKHERPTRREARGPLAVKPRWWRNRAADTLQAREYQAAVEEIEQRFGPSSAPDKVPRVLINLLALDRAYSGHHYDIWRRCAEVLYLGGYLADARREYLALDRAVRDIEVGRKAFGPLIDYRLYLIDVRRARLAAAKTRLDRLLARVKDGKLPPAFPSVAGQRSVDLEQEHWEDVHEKHIVPIFISKDEVLRLSARPGARPRADARAQETLFSDERLYRAKFSRRRWKRTSNAFGNMRLQHPSRPLRQLVFVDARPAVPRYEGFTSWDAVLVINRVRAVTLKQRGVMTEVLEREDAEYWTDERILRYTLTTRLPARGDQPEEARRRVLLFWPDGYPVIAFLKCVSSARDEAFSELETFVATITDSGESPTRTKRRRLAEGD